MPQKKTDWFSQFEPVKKEDDWFSQFESEPVENPNSKIGPRPPGSDDGGPLSAAMNWLFTPPKSVTNTAEKAASFYDKNPTSIEAFKTNPIGAGMYAAAAPGIRMTAQQVNPANAILAASGATGVGGLAAKGIGAIQGAHGLKTAYEGDVPRGLMELGFGAMPFAEFKLPSGRVKPSFVNTTGKVEDFVSDMSATQVRAKFGMGPREAVAKGIVTKSSNGLFKPVPEIKAPTAPPQKLLGGATTEPKMGPFISGEAGTAEPHNYPVDMGPNPENLSGTVPSSQFGEVVRVPPTIAANYGTGLGKPVSAQPRIEGQQIISPNRMLPKFGSPEKGIDIDAAKDKIAQTTKSLFDRPQAASTSSGGVKIGADIESLGKVLGSSLYKGDIATIATKELLQNSLDAVRHLGDAGQVAVEVNRSDHYVQVADNGKGLTLQELQSVFTDLGSSGKRSDTSAIGGFGLAKAAPLLGGEKVHVESIVKEANGKYYKHEFTGTPDELIKGIDVKTTPISRQPIGGAKIKTGTKVRTYVPSDSYLGGAESYVTNLTKNSFGVKAKVGFKQGYSWEDGKETILESPKINPEDIINLTGEHADVEMHVPADSARHESDILRYQILNNGMWQSQGYHSLGTTLPGIPKTVYVNVKSKVPEGHTQYPFTANREELRGSTEKLINDYLDNNIVKPGLLKYKNALNAAYDGMLPANLPDAPEGSKPFVVYDVGKKLSPEELTQFVNQPKNIELSTHISDILHEAMSLSGTAKWNERLEKIGLVLEPGLYGIHVPSPSTGKSAILINPFAAMDKTPDQAAANILHTILHEMAHVEGGGHDENFTSRLGDIYGKYGYKESIGAQKRIFESIIDPANPNEYHPEIQNILQQYTESRGRAATQEDILSRTGIGSKINRTGKKQIPGDDGTASEGTIAKLLDAIEEAGAARDEQNFINQMEHAARIRAANKTGNNRGESGFHMKLGKLSGEFEKADFAPIRSSLNQGEIDSLFNTIFSPVKNALTDYQRINAGVGLAKILGDYGGRVPAPYELRMLSSIFGDDLSKVVMMHGGLGGPIKLTAEMVNVPKSLKASLDFSAPLRQGLPLWYTDAYWRAFDDMFKAWGSERAYNAAMDSIMERPFYEIGQKAGLKLTGANEEFSNREEAFVSSLVERAESKIPGYRHIALVARSDRAYVAFLNKLRSDAFDAILSKGIKAGENAEDVAPDLARFVNTTTGRGSLGRFEKNAAELNIAFFSPRLIKSRIDMLNPNYYIKLHPFVRKESIKALFAVAGVGLIVSALGYESGASIGLDPTSPDFMKLKFGNTRLDPWDSFQQYIVAASRVLSNKMTTESGTHELGKGMYPSRIGLILGVGGRVPSFMENKFSPLFAFIDAIAKPIGRDGKPTNISNEVLNLFMPMFLQDTYDVWKDNPDLFTQPISSIIGKATMIGAAGLGMNIQTYDNKPKPAMRIQNPSSLRP